MKRRSFLQSVGALLGGFFVGGADVATKGWKRQSFGGADLILPDSRCGFYAYETRGVAIGHAGLREFEADIDMETYHKLLRTSPMGISIAVPMSNPGTWDIRVETGQAVAPQRRSGEYDRHRAGNSRDYNTSGRNLEKDANGNYVGVSAPFDPVTRANNILREDGKGYHLRRVKTNGVVAVKAHDNRTRQPVTPNRAEAYAAALAGNLLRLKREDQPVELRDLKRQDPTMHALVVEKMRTV